MMISSQRYLDDSLVAEKIVNEDYNVLVSPVFVVDGEEYQVILDGHHSLAAAKQAGAEPVFVVADCSDSDNVGLIEAGKIDDFLVACHIDDNYYNIEDGRYVWQ